MMRKKSETKSTGQGFAGLPRLPARPLSPGPAGLRISQNASYYSFSTIPLNSRRDFMEAKVVFFLRRKGFPLCNPIPKTPSFSPIQLPTV